MLIVQKLVYNPDDFTGYEDLVQYVMFVVDVLNLNPFVVFLKRAYEVPKGSDDADAAKATTEMKKALVLYAEIETCAPYMAVDLTLYPEFFDLWKSSRRGAKEFCRLTIVHEFIHVLVEYAPGGNKSDRIEALCDAVSAAIQGLITNLAILGMSIPSYRMVGELPRMRNDKSGVSEREGDESDPLPAVAGLDKDKEVH